MDELTIDEALAEECDFDSEPGEFLDDDRANRLLRVHTNLTRDLADVEYVYNAERERLDGWRDDRTAKIRARVEWVERSLELYHRAKLAQDPKLVTIDLPNGQHRARKQQPEFIVDPAVFLPWAEANAPECIRTPEPKPAPDMAAIKKTLTVDSGSEGDTVHALALGGEVVPGVSVVLRGRKHEVVR
jgi:hypothetical protein